MSKRLTMIAAGLRIAAWAIGAPAVGFGILHHETWLLVAGIAGWIVCQGAALLASSIEIVEGR